MTPELMFDCIKNLNAASRYKIPACGRTPRLKSCDLGRSQHDPYRPLEVYRENPLLGISRENVSVGAMICERAKVPDAEPGEVRGLLTFIACFTDTEDAWGAKRKSMG